MHHWSMDRAYSGVDSIEGEGDRRKVGVIQELAKGGQVSFFIIGWHFLATADVNKLGCPRF